MIKKKAKKAAAKKAARTKSAPVKKVKKAEPSAEDVRKKVTRLVKSQARKMAQAVIGRGMAGDVAPVKYLFEVSGVFPPLAQGTEGSPREDSLAETLLHRLNIPIEPVKTDDDDEPVILGAPAVAEEDKDEDEDENPGGGSDAKPAGEDEKASDDTVE
jgi:hypothetical protein